MQYFVLHVNFYKIGDCDGESRWGECSMVVVNDSNVKDQIASDRGRELMRSLEKWLSWCEVEELRLVLAL